MNRILKILCGAACAFAFCFLAIGYAAVQDELLVTGSVTIERAVTDISISHEDIDAYSWDPVTGELTIKETYTDSTDNENYRVTGILENGFVGYSEAANVTSVHIPKTVETIGDNAFTGCSNLKSFTVDSENEYFIAIDQVLFNEAGTNLLRYPACNKYPSPMLYHIPSATSEINVYAFCDLPEGTLVVTQNSVRSPWGASSPCLILVAPEHYSAIQSFTGDSVNGYTITCDSSVANTNLVFKNKEGARKWAAVDDSLQFTIPASICNIEAPSVMEVATVVGDINKAQLTTDAEDGIALIGGGEWQVDAFDKTFEGVNNLTIQDGEFNGILDIRQANVIINGGMFNSSTVWFESVSMTITDGVFLGSQFYNAGGSGFLELKIEGGTFNWTRIYSSTQTKVVIITGGTFRFDPSEYVPETTHCVVDNGDGTWTVSDANAAVVNEEETLSCSCESKCTELNDACEVCKTDITNCKGTEVPIVEELLCSCETKCTELTETCEVCKTDIVLCNGTEVTETTEPESPAGDSSSNGEQGEQPTEDTETTPSSDVSDGDVIETEETKTPDGQNASESEEISEPVIITDPVILPSEDEEQEFSDDQQGQE